MKNEIDRLVTTANSLRLSCNALALASGKDTIRSRTQWCVFFISHAWISLMSRPTLNRCTSSEGHVVTSNAKCCFVIWINNNKRRIHDSYYVWVMVRRRCSRSIAVIQYSENVGRNTRACWDAFRLALRIKDETARCGKKQGKTLFIQHARLFESCMDSYWRCVWALWVHYHSCYYRHYAQPEIKKLQFYIFMI